MTTTTSLKKQKLSKDRTQKDELKEMKQMTKREINYHKETQRQTTTTKIHKITSRCETTKTTWLHCLQLLIVMSSLRGFLLYVDGMGAFNMCCSKGPFLHILSMVVDYLELQVTAIYYYYCFTLQYLGLFIWSPFKTMKKIYKH